jgi:hypothetical protein
MADDFDDDLNTPNEADLDACYGGKYLGAVDVGDRKIKSRISKVRKETMQQQGGKPERPKFVVYFTNLDKGVVLNTTNKNTLVEKLGKNPADWINAEVGLYTEPTQYAGKPTRGLRLRVLSVPKATTKSAPIAKPIAKPASNPAAEADSEDPSFGLDDEADFSEAAE